MWWGGVQPLLPLGTGQPTTDPAAPCTSLRGFQCPLRSLARLPCGGWGLLPHMSPALCTFGPLHSSHPGYLRHQMCVGRFPHQQPILQLSRHHGCPAIQFGSDTLPGAGVSPVRLSRLETPASSTGCPGRPDFCLTWLLATKSWVPMTLIPSVSIIC